MSLEDVAGKCLNDLIGEETTLGHVGGRETDPNRWHPAGTKGESYAVILAAVRDAVAAERERFGRVLRELVVGGWEMHPDHVEAILLRPRAPDAGQGGFDTPKLPNAAAGVPSGTPAASPSPS